MEILIKDPGTQHFLNDKAHWVQAEAEAQPFPLPLDALKFCVEHEIKGMELSFRYPCWFRIPPPEPGPQVS